jgi:cell division protein FtsW
MTPTTVRAGGPRPEGGHSRQPAPRRQGPSAGSLRDLLPGSYHLVWITALLLLTAGICMMLSVSVAKAVTGGDKYMFVRDQGIAAAVGLVCLVILWRMDYRKLRAAAVLFLAIVGLSLLAMHIPGVSHAERGSASWIPLGPIRYQPSEFAKLAMVLAGAHLLTSRRLRTDDFLSYMRPFGAAGLIMCVLVAAEGDLGTAIIVFGLLMGMLWLAGMKGSHWTLLAGTGVVGALTLICFSSERLSRVFSFLDPSSDPQGASYQLWQALMALGRGGWFGVGPGESVQKFAYLPEAHNDMIYAILGEEFGLLGAGLVIALFGLFAAACWRLARRCSDPMGKYLIAGCGMLVTLEAVINIGGVIGFMPLTGVPLPFISYGRNSLVVMLMAVGLILGVARRATASPAPSSVARYDNVTHIDRGRWDGRARGARSGAR